MAGSNVGEYVTIEHGNFLPNPNQTPLALVIQRFDEVTEEANNLLNMLRGEDGSGGYLGDLNESIAAAPEYEIEVPDVDTDVTFPSIGSAPTWSDTLASYPTASIDEPTLEDMPTITSPDDPTSSMPSEVNPTINWSEITLPTELYTELLARLVQDLEDGATGLSATVEDAIMARARARQVVINSRNYDRVLAELDGMDFSLPSGALASALVEQAQDTLAAETDVNNSIMIQSSDLAQKNSQFVISVSKDLEGILRNYNISYNQLELQYATAAANLILENYKAQVAAYVSELEALRAELQIQIAHIEAVVASNRGLVDMYIAQWQAHSVEVGAVTAENTGKVDVYTGRVRGYAAEADARNSIVQAQVAQIGAKIQEATLQVNAAIEEAKLGLGGYSAEYSMRADVAKALTGIVAQVTASMLAAINASAGTDYNANESASEQWSHSDQLSEHHSYDEDPDV